MEQIKSQGEWLNIIKSGACQSCHALGTPGTRTISKRLGDFQELGRCLGARGSKPAAHRPSWRATSRASAPKKALKMFGEWTDSIAAGELPFAVPERPQGISRNVVVTEWEWSDPTAYLHDEISTDRWNPSVNAKGKLYGSAEDSDRLHAGARSGRPCRQRGAGFRCAIRTRRMSRRGRMVFRRGGAPNPIWNSQTITHNPMMDEKGRVWMTSQIRPQRKSRLVQGRIGASVGEGVSDQDVEPQHRDVRSAVREIHAALDVLPDPSPRLLARPCPAFLQRRCRRARGARLAGCQEVRTNQ